MTFFGDVAHQGLIHTETKKPLGGALRLVWYLKLLLSATTGWVVASTTTRWIACFAGAVCGSVSAHENSLQKNRSHNTHSCLIFRQVLSDGRNGAQSVAPLKASSEMNAWSLFRSAPLSASSIHRLYTRKNISMECPSLQGLAAVGGQHTQATARAMFINVGDAVAVQVAPRFGGVRNPAEPENRLCRWALKKVVVRRFGAWG